MTYVATKWDSAAQKVKFEKQFKKFVSNGFKFEHFPKWFYIRLSMCFHHIAHYNQHGFYTTWFKEEKDRQEFIERIKNMSIYGDPEYTYSDVEKVLQDWVKEKL